MAYFLFQGNYPPASLRAMTTAPQDRAATITPMFEAAGGKLHHFFFALGESDWFFFALGESDWYLLAELPDTLAAASVSMAVAASGAVTGLKTTPLFTSIEGVGVMQPAGKLGYRPPTAT